MANDDRGRQIIMEYNMKQILSDKKRNILVEILCLAANARNIEISHKYFNTMAGKIEATFPNEKAVSEKN